MAGAEITCRFCKGAGVVPKRQDVELRASLMAKREVQSALDRITRQSKSWHEAYQQSEVQAAEHLARALKAEKAMAELIPGLQWLSRVTLEGGSIKWDGNPSVVFTEKSVAELMDGINAVVKAGPKEVLG